MKFPRNARIFKGHLDAAPFAGVFFCLLIFVLLASLVYTPGIPVNLPRSSSDLPGIDGPLVTVSLGANGQCYFENQIIRSNELKARLTEKVARSSEPLTLMVVPDQHVTAQNLASLYDLGLAAGITNFAQAMLPRSSGATPGPGKP